VGVTEGLGEIGLLREEGVRAERSFLSNLAWWGASRWPPRPSIGWWGREWEDISSLSQPRTLSRGNLVKKSFF